MVIRTTTSGPLEKVLRGSFGPQQQLNDLAHLFNLIKQMFALVGNSESMTFTSKKRSVEVQLNRWPNLKKVKGVALTRPLWHASDKDIVAAERLVGNFRGAVNDAIPLPFTELVHWKIADSMRYASDLGVAVLEECKSLGQKQRTTLVRMLRCFEVIRQHRIPKDKLVDWHAFVIETWAVNNYKFDH